MKETVKDKDIVITGDYLGVVEEFLPADKHSTFIKDGEIYAAKTGEIEINNDKREILINEHQEIDRKVVKIGDIVIGEVVFLRKYSVGISFHVINSKYHFNSPYFGNIHVSQVSNKYIEKIQDAFQITDLVRARVTKQNLSEYDLTTVGQRLGTITADCLICGTTLKQVGYNKLRCQRCGNFEKRKLSNDFGNVEKHLKF